MAASCIALACRIAVVILLTVFGAGAAERQSIKAVLLPIADHYAAILAHEKYGNEMTKADFTIELVITPRLVRAYFESEDVDLAIIPCPIAVDMFAEEAHCRWVSLAHRDGTALAINKLMNSQVHLPAERSRRKPDGKVAEAFREYHTRTGHAVECAVPDLPATHTVVLYKYLKDHGQELQWDITKGGDVIPVEVAPPKTPVFIRRNSSLNQPAAFEQSLPWADIVETQGYGYVAWYSKDVMNWPKGHVECIIIATDKCMRNKREALKEVIYYLHKCGVEIEHACSRGGSEMAAIADLLRAHVPEHTTEAIIQSLDPDLNAINFLNLNVDKPGVRQIMDLAVEAGILKQSIDVLFASAVNAYGAQLVGVILAGANSDGSNGLRRIQQCGGLTIVQDPLTAESGFMAQAAIDTGDVDYILALNEVGPFITGEFYAEQDRRQWPGDRAIPGCNGGNHSKRACRSRDPVGG